MQEILENADAELAELSVLARTYAEHTKSLNTMRAYAGDFENFRRWCDRHNLSALPASPQTVALYATWCAQRYKVSTIERRVASIAHAHAAAGHASPTQHGAVKAVLRGVRRANGTAQTQKTALLVHDLRQLVLHVDATRLIGLRDRALLLLGFASALRRSELVGLDVDDLGFERNGVVLKVRRSKTDQEGLGAEIAVGHGKDSRTCPVRALSAWLRAAGITSGPVFLGMRHGRHVRPTRLTARMVAAIVQRHAAAAGFDPAHFGGHSLRAGFATSAAQAGRDERSIMRQTRHTSVTVARRYIRQASRWSDHPGLDLGL